MPDENVAPNGVKYDILFSIGKYLLAAAGGAAIALSLSNSNYPAKLSTKDAFLAELRRENYMVSDSGDGNMITKYWCRGDPQYTGLGHTLADLKERDDGRLVLDFRHTGYVSFPPDCFKTWIDDGQIKVPVDQKKADAEEPDKLKRIASKYPIQIIDTYAEEAQAIGVPAKVYMQNRYGYSEEELAERKANRKW